MGQWIDEQIKNGKLTAKMLYDKFGFDDVIGIKQYGHKALAGPIYLVGLIVPVEHTWDLKPANSISVDKCRSLSKMIQREAVWLKMVWINPNTIISLGMEGAYSQALNTILSEISPYNICSILITERLKIFKYPHGVTAANIPVVEIARKSSTVCDILGAAEIVARVAREASMSLYHLTYPMYNWDKNMGFASGDHFTRIQQFGASSLHHPHMLRKYSLQKENLPEDYIENYNFS